MLPKYPSNSKLLKMDMLPYKPTFSLDPELYSSNDGF